MFQESPGIGQLKTTAQLNSLIKMSGLVNVEPAEDVEIDGKANLEIRQAIQAGNDVEIKVVKICCQVAPEELALTGRTPMYDDQVQDCTSFACRTVISSLPFLYQSFPCPFHVCAGKRVLTAQPCWESWVLGLRDCVPSLGRSIRARPHKESTQSLSPCFLFGSLHRARPRKENTQRL